MNMEMLYIVFQFLKTYRPFAISLQRHYQLIGVEIANRTKKKEIKIEENRNYQKMYRYTCYRIR